MEYSKIVSVTGLPGLYELVNTKTDGAIVRSLDDKTTKFASSRIHNFSHLESIEVFTTAENVNLVDIFQAMKNTGESLPETKDDATVKKYFEKVYPDIDFERVYSSDLKKMIKWYDVLSKNDIELKLSEPEPEVEEAIQPEEELKEVKQTEKNATRSAQRETPKAKAKKTSKQKTEEKPKASKNEKPGKKTAKKKKK